MLRGCWMLFQLFKVPWVCRFSRNFRPPAFNTHVPCTPIITVPLPSRLPQTLSVTSHSLWSTVTYFLPEVPPRIRPPLDPLVNHSLSCSSQTPFPLCPGPQQGPGLETQLLSLSGFHTESLVHLLERSANFLLPFFLDFSPLKKPASPTPVGHPSLNKGPWPCHRFPACADGCEKQSKAQLVNVQNVFALSPKSAKIFFLKQHCKLPKLIFFLFHTQNFINSLFCFNKERKM